MNIDQKLDNFYIKIRAMDNMPYVELDEEQSKLLSYYMEEVMTHLEAVRSTLHTYVY